MHIRNVDLFMRYSDDKFQFFKRSFCFLRIVCYSIQKSKQKKQKIPVAIRRC